MVSSAAAAAMQQFALLPEIGPLPTARPDFVPVPGIDPNYAAAYTADAPVAAVGAFDAILHRDGSLSKLTDVRG